MNITQLSSSWAHKAFALVATMALLASALPIQVNAQNAGSLWTNIGPCGSPQNVNNYEVGQDFFVNASNFQPETTYTWVMKEPGNKPAFETGFVTTDSNGDVCEKLLTLEAKHIGGPYQFQFGEVSKNDNFKVDEATPMTGTLTVTKELVSPDADRNDFGFTIGGGSPVQLGNNPVQVQVPLGAYEVTEVAWSENINLDLYDIDYSTGCSGTMTAAGAACTITNTQIDRDTTLTLVKNFVGGPATTTDWRVIGFVDGTTLATFSGVGTASITLTYAELLALPGTTWTLDEEVADTDVDITDNYIASAWECSGNSVEIAGNQLTLVAGEDVTCTITNRYDNGTTPDPILGCTDDSALNYNPAATEDDGSCQFPPQIPQCIAANLLQNPSFEEPAISTSWQTLASIPGWMASNSVEIWRNFQGGASDGEQNVELAVESPTTLSQEVMTTPGATYLVQYDFSPRIGRAAGDNMMDVEIDGTVEQSVMVDGIGLTANDWETYWFTFEATDTTTDVSFVHTGANSSQGSLLDNTVVCLEAEAPVPTYIIEGYVWHDDNRNQEWDGFEEQENEEEMNDEDIEVSLAGWTVNITNGVDSYATNTDENGYYSFEVPAGTWTITEVVEEGWERTTQESFIVTVPEPAPEPVELSLFETVLNFMVPTAHAAVMDRFGFFNFGNDRIASVPARVSGGGGVLTGRDPESDSTPEPDRTPEPTPEPTPEVAGETISIPEPQVLGEQVSIVPVGAPATGKGGAAAQLTIIGQLLAVPRRFTRQ